MPFGRISLNDGRRTEDWAIQWNIYAPAGAVNFAKTNQILMNEVLMQLEEQKCAPLRDRHAVKHVNTQPSSRKTDESSWTSRSNTMGKFIISELFFSSFAHKSENKHIINNDLHFLSQAPFGYHPSHELEACRLTSGELIFDTISAETKTFPKSFLS